VLLATAPGRAFNKKRQPRYAAEWAREIWPPSRFFILLAYSLIWDVPYSARAINRSHWPSEEWADGAAGRCATDVRMSHLDSKPTQRVQHAKTDAACLPSPQTISLSDWPAIHRAQSSSFCCEDKPAFPLAGLGLSERSSGKSNTRLGSPNRASKTIRSADAADYSNAWVTRRVAGSTIT